MKKIICTIVALALLLGMAAMAEGTSYKVGICNYVDDASLNQIVENIQNRLGDIAAEKGVSIDIDYQNCNADASVMQQIISNFIADGVDRVWCIGRGPHLPLRQEPQGSSDFRLRSQGPCRLGTGESGLVLG